MFLQKTATIEIDNIFLGKKIQIFNVFIDWSFVEPKTNIFLIKIYSLNFK